ncbi:MULTISPECIES: hypothetical protein [unclassified Novosphingobium]|uniref:GH39 family glycosyl hydrolase n=1 Tax=unclassified Novosphingobium TaxID=2644732 RepID=UPI0017E4974D|nr:MULTISPECIES: hypothetical protein [unclassified Novosphingobium]MBB3357854.1 beta-xylosidase/photosystem II stability/assembly factor-like uncharacterized protein [Novosphingobium sp. BK256]MBB3374215.1 beta-xylosidase/photosystem II stability/assembly factor-like uncharacterized protein [Novosphingobium sp. BK280]MBB3378627.1 beta-xylosidase/photosystem II stability/assembly factor-like uncharacterized protein [Novosphingobium sp. BK258]MBB3420321.1 beta-xylosidase/photosystem II stability
MPGIPFRGARRLACTTLASVLALGVAAPLHAQAPAAANAAATPLASGPYHWQTVPFGAGGFVDGFLYHPRTPGILYARTDIGGMYRFDFENKRWIPLLDHLGRDDGDLMGILSFAVDPNAPDRVYAAAGLYLSQWSRKGAILRSDDRGRTWQKTELPIGVGGNSDGRGTGERLAVDPRQGDVLYFGSNRDGLWKSTDRGLTFARTGAKVGGFSLVAVDPAVPGQVWAGSTDGTGALMLSRDGGASFSAVPGLPAMVPQHLVFGRDGSLYVTFAGGDQASTLNPSNIKTGAVWKRDGRDRRWHDITPTPPAPGLPGGFSGVDLASDGTLAVSTIDRWAPGDDIYLSRDGGAHWDALSAHARHDPGAYPWLVDYMKGRDTMGHWLADLKFNPFKSDEMIYGTGYGLWISRNLASAKPGEPVTFDFTVGNLEEAATLQMASPTGGAAVLAAFGDVGGGAWEDLARTPPRKGLFTPASETNFSIDYAGAKPGSMVRLVDHGPSYGYTTTDGGATWTPFASAAYHPPAPGGDWRRPGVAAISAKGTTLVWAPEKDGLYVSKDMGKTWQPSTGIAARADTSYLPVADKAADGLFYVYDQASSAVLASGDGGSSFTTLIAGLPKVESWQKGTLAVVPGLVRDLWLALPMGLFHSPDSKTKVTQMRKVTEAWLVSFGAPVVKDAYPAVFLWGKVMGQEGLWRSDDAGANWVRINSPDQQFGTLRAIAGDMLDPGTLYLAPHGRGIMVGMPANKPLPVAGAAPGAAAASASVPAATATRQIAVDVARDGGPIDRFFDLSIGSDYPGTLRRPENMAQLKLASEELGFRTIRFHDIFHDALGTVKRVNGKIVYDWTAIDALYDDLKARHLRPFVELGFTPDALKTSDQTIFYWKGNTSHPQPGPWRDLVDAFVRHMIARYGQDDVRQWYFEVWNEPNLAGFWENADQQAYFDLYLLTARTIKAIDPQLRVGGPSTAGAAWVPELLAAVKAKGGTIDFVTTHTYGVNGGFLDEMGKDDTKLDPSPQAITGDVRRVRQQIDASAFPGLPLYFTEWSTSYTPRDLVHDSYVSAPYILSKLKSVEGAAQGMSYWVYSDLFEEPGPPTTEFHGGFGLMTKDGIRKPAWFAYKYLHALQGRRVPADDAQSWIARDGRKVAAVVWDFEQPAQPTSNRSFFGKLVPNHPAAPVRLAFSHLAPGRYRYTLHRTGYRANDAYSAYIDMGAPERLTPAQLASLAALAQDKPEASETVTVSADGQLMRDVAMHSNDVTLATLEPVQ